MGDRSNVQIVQDCYAAFGRGDMPGLIAELSPDIQWDDAGPSEIPWSGTFHGHDGVMQFFGAIAGAVDFLDFAPTAFIGDGDRVVVLGHEKMKNKTNGREWEVRWAHAWTLENGKVTAFREYTDTAAVAAGFRA